MRGVDLRRGQIFGRYVVEEPLGQLSVFSPLSLRHDAEAVETRDHIVAVAAADRHEAWAADAKGTLFRRAHGFRWVRAPVGPLPVAPVAMWAVPGRIRVLTKDGAVVEARRSA
jgi:hypothetical protein